MKNFFECFSFPFVLLRFQNEENEADTFKSSDSLELVIGKEKIDFEASSHPDSTLLVTTLVELLQKAPKLRRERRHVFTVKDCKAEYVQPTEGVYIAVMFLEQRYLIQDNAVMNNIGHDIKTPLSNILLSLSDLYESNPSPGQRLTIDVIRDCSTYLLGVINNLIDYTKLQSGNMILENRVFKLVDLVESSFRIVSYSRREHDIDIAYFIDPGTPDFFTGDINRLKQIIVNLIDNGVKNNHKRGSVSVNVHYKDSKLTFFIKDNGHGMNESERESFCKTSINGGLGLLIVKSLAELMYGKVTLEYSEPGKGSVVRVDIPISSTTQDIEYCNISGKLKGKRILVVEDNSTNRTSLLQLLSKWQVEPIGASTSQEAIVVSKIYKFDMVFMDIRLENNVNGIQVAKELKLDCPIVGLSSLVNLKKSKDLFYEILEKPIKETELLSVILKALGIKETSTLKTVVFEHDPIQMSIWRSYLGQLNILDYTHYTKLPTNLDEIANENDVILVEEKYRDSFSRFQSIVYLRRNLRFEDFKALVDREFKKHSALVK